MNDAELQESLFPELPVTERAAPDRTPGEIRRARQDIAVAYGQHPLTAALRIGLALHPDPGRTCGSCRFREPVRSPSGGRTYPKCLLRDSDGRLRHVTRGPGTDVPRRWPACRHHEHQATNESPEGGSV